MKKQIALVLAAGTIFASAVVASISSTKDGTGDFKTAWGSYDSGGQKNVTVTYKITPCTTPHTTLEYKVIDKDDNVVVSGTSTAGGVIGPLTATASRIEVKYIATGTFKIEVEVSGAGTATDATWVARPNVGPTLWSRATADTVNFRVRVDSGEDPVTVQAYDGTDLVKEWSASDGDDVSASVEATSIKILPGDSTGSFSCEIS